MNKEYKTLSAMICLYCHKYHFTKGEKLCFSCSELLAYAKSRLDRCPYAEDKPSCEQCPVHCYKPAQRKNIQKVMRYAGPRMMRSYPLLAIRHLVKRMKKPKV